MKSWRHTDLVEPHIVFKSETPVRILHFPVLQSFQEDVKEQIAQLIDANTIGRNMSEWSCPMLIVCKKESFPDVKPSCWMAFG